MVRVVAQARQRADIRYRPVDPSVHHQGGRVQQRPSCGYWNSARWPPATWPAILAEPVMTNVGIVPSPKARLPSARCASLPNKSGTLAPSSTRDSTAHLCRAGRLQTSRGRISIPTFLFSAISLLLAEVPGAAYGFTEDGGEARSRGARIWKTASTGGIGGTLAVQRAFALAPCEPR